MKKQLLAVAAGLVMSILAADVCYAQQGVLTVNIPFEFQAGNKSLPPGEWSVETVLTGEGALLRLRQVKGEASILFSTITVESKHASPGPKLVFHRYSKNLFLAQIWMAGKGHQLVESDRERRIARGEKGSEVALRLPPADAKP